MLDPGAPKDEKEKAEAKKKEEIKQEIKRMKDNNEIIWSNILFTFINLYV